MEDCNSMPTKNTKTSKSRGLGKGIGNLFQEEDTNDQKVVVKEVVKEVQAVNKKLQKLVVHLRY